MIENQYFKYFDVYIIVQIILSTIYIYSFYVKKCKTSLTIKFVNKNNI